MKAGLCLFTVVGTKIHFTGNLNRLNRRMIPLSIFVSFNMMFEYSIAWPKLFTVVRHELGFVSRMIWVLFSVALHDSSLRWRSFALNVGTDFFWRATFIKSGLHETDAFKLAYPENVNEKECGQLILVSGWLKLGYYAKNQHC